MKLIESIDSIYPAEIIFNINKLEEKLTPNVEVEIQVGMAVEELKMNDQGNFRAIVSFMLRFGDDEENEILLKLSHQVDFTSLKENFNISDVESNFVLFEIVEPYVRFRFNELTSQTKFSSLDIPYRFWEMASDGSKL